MGDQWDDGKREEETELASSGTPKPPPRNQDDGGVLREKCERPAKRRRAVAPKLPGRDADPQQRNAQRIVVPGAGNSKIVILIKMDKPKGITFAADSLSPVFGDLAQFLIRYFKIPPTR